MPDKMLAIGVLPRLVIPSSFVAKVETRRIEQNEDLATFKIGEGGWIIQAKAMLVVPAPTSNTVSLVITLLRHGDQTVFTDSSGETTSNIASMTAIVGTYVPKTANVNIVVHGGGGATLAGIVITGIRQDDLINLDL